MFQHLASYLELMAQGDVKMLESTGYDLRREKTRSGARSDFLLAPSDLRVTQGRVSGTLEVRVARLTSAASYEVATSQGDGSASGE